MKITIFTFLLASFFIFNSHANQIKYLDQLIKSRTSNKPPRDDAWPEVDVSSEYSPVYIGTQDGLMEADKIDELPGQPEGVEFNHYSGYVTVDPSAGRALFYYFVESPKNSSSNPLVLWLNGGPGCSSLGFGAMEELGPFRVNSDGKTLYKNDYAWNNVANVLFLESPAGVGYSYSNTTSDYYKMGDKITAEDSYIFLINWFERFPQYKNRDFFMTGESYSGHYVPQLAYTILLNNKKTNQTVINLKGIAIGNALIDDYDNNMGGYDYRWTHALNSDETNAAIHMHCQENFSTPACKSASNQSDIEMGNVNLYHIYAPLCSNASKIISSMQGTVYTFDPCTGDYVKSYLNLPEVQKAFHVKLTPWDHCSDIIPGWNDAPTTVLPLVKDLMASNIRVWIYSGDIDSRVSITSSKYSITKFNLPIQTSWRPWYTNQEVGGYVVEYEGLVLASIRGAGHEAPSYQPERSLTMISSFLQGKLPPSQSE